MTPTRSQLLALSKKATQGEWFVSGVRFRMNGGEWHSVNRYDAVTERDENIACFGFDPRTGAGLPDAHFAAACVNEIRRQLSEGDAVLDSPATVGATTFNAGVSERLVIDRAKREYEHRQKELAEPTESEEMIRQFRALPAQPNEDKTP